MRKSLFFSFFFSIACGASPAVERAAEVDLRTPRSAAAPLAPPEGGAPVDVKIGAPPASFRADGDLAEWKLDEGGGAVVRAAISAEGLFVAVSIPKADPRASSPLALVLRHELPPMPPIAYANQFGAVTVATKEGCDTDARGDATVEDCRAWVDAQLALRAKIEARFSRRVALEDAALGTRRTEGDRVRWEGRIPWKMLPPATGPWLEHLELSVVATGSSAPVAILAGTFDPPYELAPKGTLLRRILESENIAPNETVAFFEPSSPNELHYLRNEWQGYQWAPTAPSPGEVVVNLGERKPIGKLGDVVVEKVVALPGFGWQTGDVLVSSKGSHVVDMVALPSAELAGSAARGSNLDLGFVIDGYMSSLLVGMCGACPTVDVELLSVLADGTFTKPRSLLTHTSGAEEKVDVHVEPDLSAVTARYELEEDSPMTGAKAGTHEERYRWDAKKGDYELTTRDRPRSRSRGKK